MGNAHAHRSAERKRREIDPTIALLAELSERLKADPAAPAYLRDRVVRMHEFLATLGTWYEQVKVLPKVDARHADEARRQGRALHSRRRQKG